MTEKTQAQMWEEIAEVAFELCNDREAEFIEDIEHRAKSEELTPKQLDWLKKIYEKACRSRL